MLLSTNWKEDVILVGLLIVLGIVMLVGKATDAIKK